jgi:hypothetical protein
MTDLLTPIREKCIDANPELDKSWAHVVVDENGRKISCGHRELGRPIRLADVLLAMDYHKPGHKKCVTTGGSFASIASFGPVYFVESHWNLREDDLEKQSAETLEFLANLLGV